jgi:sialidase-1
MVALKDGRLLLCYTRGVYEPNTKNGGPEIVGRYSSDKGRTWGEERVVISTPRPQGPYYYSCPSLLRLGNGDLLLSYIYDCKSEPWYGHTYCRRSTDDGQTWGDQLILTPYPGTAHVHNDKLVQLSSGRIVAAAATFLKPDPSAHRGVVALAFYSDDGGIRWNASENVVNALPVEAQEPAIVELKDKRLMMLCRTYNGFVLRAYSSDKGVTWSKGEPVPELTLPANSSALNVDRIPQTGDLILLRCSGGEGGRRTPFVSAISRDEGKTWEKDRVIQGDPADDYGYPSLTFVDSLALISYHQRDGVHVARISIDWFYQGPSE